jgi:hypothetical protein
MADTGNYGTGVSDLRLSRPPRRTSGAAVEAAQTTPGAPDEWYVGRAR